MTEKKEKNNQKTLGTDALDDFWDIGMLAPKSAARPSYSSPPKHTDAVEVEIPRVVVPNEKHVVTEQKLLAGETAISVGGTHYVPPHTPGEAEKASLPCDEYVPESALLHTVKMFEWPTGYHYFDQYIREACRFHTMQGKEAPYKSFFSYLPQYIQMNQSQTAWYLWWRQEARAHRYMKTDYAYVLLYLFELINLPAAPQSEEARDARDAMASVWMAYRDAYRQMDHYMSDWLCDYCLIHHLSAPLEILSPAMDHIIRESRFKEFYLSAVMEQDRDKRTMAAAQILLRFACQYDYGKSKFAGGEHKGLFDALIPAVIADVLPLLLGGGEDSVLVDMKDCTITRDAYPGALCAYRHKRRIEVSYISFSRTHELRFLIGDMVKHIENRIRSRIGVRSRLSVMALPIPLRDALDAFLLPRLPEGVPLQTKKKDIPPPSYEKMYDAPHKDLSLADADAIEKSSWETTRILIEAFDGEADRPADEGGREDAVIEPSLSPSEPVLTDASSLVAALGDDRAVFLRFALNRDANGQREVAYRLRKMPDALADEINGITAECEIFDMVLEDDGMGNYTVLDDYREILNALLGGNT